MERIWRDAPVAALRVWEPVDATPRAEANPAAQAWGAADDIGAAAWSALARQGHRHPPGATFQAEWDGPAATATKVALADGFLLWLQAAAAGSRALAERLDLLAEVGRMGVSVRDLRTGRGHWDSHVFRLFGLDENQATPTLEAVLERVHPDDRAAVGSPLETLARRPARGESRFRIVRPGGEIRHVHSIHEVRPRADGSPGLLVDVLIDDTETVERIQAEQRVAAFRNRALALAEVSVWRVDLATRRVHFDGGPQFTPRAVDAAGVPLDALRQTVHPDDLPALLAAADETLAGDRVVEVTARHRNPQGGWSTLLTRRVAVRDAAGTPVAVDGISIDITAQVAERERSRALLEQSRRAEQARADQQQFLARMSHELRTPINAVLGFARVMAADAEHALPALQRQRLDHVLDAAARLAALTEGLLEVAGDGAAASPEAAGAATRAAPPGASDGRLRMVCVEDNPVNMMLVRELLALRPQIELHCAVDGFSGVDLALQVQPHVMLLDLQLPDIGGDEVMHRVRRQLGEGACTYIALSANAMPEHVRRMLAEGFDHYWTKPIDFGLFLGRLDEMLAARGMIPETPSALPR